MTHSKQDSKRAKLVACARSVVQRYGYKKTTVDDVAQAAGVSRAALYYYFPNREQLLRAVIRFELESFVESIRQAIDVETSATQQLLQLSRARHARLSEIKKIYSVAQDIPRELLPIARQELAQLRENEQLLLKNILLLGQRSGEFHVEDAELLALSLLAAMSGLEEEFMFDAQDQLEQGAECLMQTLLHGLLVPVTETSTGQSRQSNKT